VKAAGGDHDPSDDWGSGDPTLKGDELVHAYIPSPNFNERALPISMVVIHYTEMKPMETALGKLINPEAEVSAHYLISESGIVTRLVDEDKRAWHSGKSFWRGVKDVNSAAIGIELDHPGHDLGYRPFAETQIEALMPLLARIMKTHDVPRANVVGHSDVAPMRKRDPGELFPWELLAEHGLCLPRPRKLELGDPFPNEGAFILALERFGYDITEGRRTIEAFERRWRPERIEGVYDAQLGAILWQLLLDRDRGRAR
jgi:N-acetylmuramoyl-L-alanine amidase